MIIVILKIERINKMSVAIIIFTLLSEIILLYRKKITIAEILIKFDDKDLSIKSHKETYKSGLHENPLLLWRNNEHKYPELASLAKKYLGVQASSAGVARMLNFAGHIH